MLSLASDFDSNCLQSLQFILRHSHVNVPGYPYSWLATFLPLVIWIIYKTGTFICETQTYQNWLLTRWNSINHRKIYILTPRLTFSLSFMGYRCCNSYSIRIRVWKTIRCQGVCNHKNPAVKVLEPYSNPPVRPPVCQHCRCDAISQAVLHMLVSYSDICLI